MTKTEREELNKLSEQVYGKRLAWQKMLRKGEYKAETVMNNNNQPIGVQRLHHFTLDQIVNKMKQILADQEVSAKAKETDAP